jgi:hypothetical protein
MERRGDPGMGQAAPEEKEKYSATLRMPTQERGSATIARRPRQHSGRVRACGVSDCRPPDGSQHAAQDAWLYSHRYADPQRQDRRFPEDPKTRRSRGHRRASSRR